MADPRVFPDLDALVRLQVASGFSFRASQPRHSVLRGRHGSRLRGRGLNFEELRGYQPGDDLRHVDWRASARRGEAQVRVYTEERDRSTWLLVNLAQGMFFGSAHSTKAVAAAEFAALAAWRSLASGDRVGAILFDEEQLQVYRPLRTHAQVVRILDAIVALGRSLRPGRAPGQPRLNDALERVLRFARHDALVLLIGDGAGVGKDTVPLVSRLSRHNDCIAGLVYDPMERDLPDAGPLRATDGTADWHFDSGAGALRRAFREDFERRELALTQLSRRRELALLPVHTALPVAGQLARLLGARATGPGA
ncbi:hypothetical protein HRUBRA_01120 [Pseudohaliea rubra DSM 19751]|uniref:DUF58 domain-containing protein n=1 Tax=Pseudohaliea rubra DSM 19751 TaxID=1265313 RepID=A0A095XX33_9GAMM|nr:hypothetical protein HRUBRA_01120 [Pseudohaliea rubra DSM 19751]